MWALPLSYIHRDFEGRREVTDSPSSGMVHVGDWTGQSRCRRPHCPLLVTSFKAALLLESWQQILASCRHASESSKFLPPGAPNCSEKPGSG